MILIDKTAAPPRVGVCVDAACQGNPGPVEYRGVDLETREQLFHNGPLAGGTNNVGEFLAIVHALAWLRVRGDSRPVYSDSLTAIKWVRTGKAKTTLRRDGRNEPIFLLLDRALQWLAENKSRPPLFHWQTSAWGEIVADFGRK